MELYLLRHGIAEQRRPGRDDADRVLTPEGKAKLKQVLARAKRVKVEPSLILSSPLVRAVETAQLAAEELDYEGEIVRTDALLPEAPPQALWEEIRSRRTAPAILAAGHEPMLSASVAFLLGAPSLQFDFKKGALVRMDIDRFNPEPRALLKWVLTPALA